MPFRNPGSNFRTNERFSSRALSNKKSYESFLTGSKRHQFTTVQALGDPDILLPGEYFMHFMLGFSRSATGSTDDVPLAPTDSNNYQTASVMNGSYISNYQADITIKNHGAGNPITLDIFQVAVSFWDVFVWDGLIPSACPINFDNVSVGPADLRGAVGFKAVTPTLIVENIIKNKKFLQHYIQKIGSVTLTSEDGSTPLAKFRISRVPLKCRRSQTGMFWGLFFVNDSDKNNSETLNIDTFMEISFNEHPADNRLPYLY